MASPKIHNDDGKKPHFSDPDQLLLDAELRCKEDVALIAAVNERLVTPQRVKISLDDL
ncbi:MULTISPECIES: hypothetical protein [Pseudomonas]|uniref:hypothetical protein n=1 Tax=Pseudomonas TaxID=286 RepID=UPI0015EB4A91|nr:MULTISPECIES: hypothetical protein [Pseudomonas]MBL0796826.1 hypothetical protein [Pseudomonas sp. B7]MBY9026664.1 hypothetical protein [Pseudomonas fluorescens]MBY9031417.1 hypothetical protein [Pseudomonas fluorescens]MBY9038368.1 hypothetical protein [Pseudomonas fluorescens]MBY9044586.1 hypothetical protein [Pseudomonas fluorescens]